MEVKKEEVQLHQVTVEQWVQRQWVDQNQLQVRLTENNEYNGINAGQTFLGKG